MFGMEKIFFLSFDYWQLIKDYVVAEELKMFLFYFIFDKINEMCVKATLNQLSFELSESDRHFNRMCHFADHQKWLRLACIEWVCKSELALVYMESFLDKTETTKTN